MAEDPKQDKKGAEDPKQDRKGGPNQSDAGAGCSNDTALDILRGAADLCGLLVVAVVSPLAGGRGSGVTPTGCPQKLALTELRRKAQNLDRAAHNAEPSA